MQRYQGHVIRLVVPVLEILIVVVFAVEELMPQTAKSKEKAKQLVHEWVVPLQRANQKGKTYRASQLPLLLLTWASREWACLSILSLPSSVSRKECSLSSSSSSNKSCPCFAGVPLLLLVLALLSGVLIASNVSSTNASAFSLLMFENSLVRSNFSIHMPFAGVDLLLCGCDPTWPPGRFKLENDCCLPSLGNPILLPNPGIFEYISVESSGCLASSTK